MSILQFQQVSLDEVAAVIRALPNKSFALDPLPTTRLKAVADVVVPFLTELLNRSLSDGSVLIYSKKFTSRHVSKSLIWTRQILGRTVRFPICLSRQRYWSEL